MILFAIIIFAFCAAASADELPIPPLPESQIINGIRVFQLTTDEGKQQFINNRRSPTLGYNGDYLGPTIRTRQGENIRVEMKNQLQDPTSVHWYGATVPAEADGNVHHPIPPGGKWPAVFKILQPVGTLWYHPHLMGTTAQQVYQGLTGLFIVDDDSYDALIIPQSYSIDDIPLILQERHIDSSGHFPYSPSMPGNTLLYHIHADQFFELDINGRPPFPSLSGWRIP